MLERNPGTFPPGQHHGKPDQCPPCSAWRTVPRCPCPLSGRHCGVSSQGRCLALYQVKGRRTRSDWPQRSSLSFSLSGITFKPRGALLPLLSVGGRGLAFCCVALLHSSHLCQGPWGLEVSRNSLVFQRRPCEADDSGSYLSFPSKALLRERLPPMPVE